MARETNFNNLGELINNYKNSTIEHHIITIELRNTLHENIFWKTINHMFNDTEYKFECFYNLSTSDKYPITYVYLNNPETNIMNHDAETDYYKIDPTDKKYCIELIQNKDTQLLINFIQNITICKIVRIPRCNFVNGMLQLIYNFLNALLFNGIIYLEDDSMIFDQYTLPIRLIIGRGSIYKKSGFIHINNTELNERELERELEELKRTELEISNDDKTHYEFTTNRMTFQELCKKLAYPESIEDSEFNKNFIDTRLSEPLRKKYYNLRQVYYKMKNEDYTKNIKQCEDITGGGRGRIKNYKRLYEKYVYKSNRLSKLINNNKYTQYF